LFYDSMFDDRYGAPGLYSIYRCKRCGFGRTDPVLEKEKIGKFYKRYYPLSVLSPSDVKKLAKVVPMFLAWAWGIDNTAHRHVGKDRDVLDIGSGSGTSLLEIEKVGSRGFGVEPDPNAQKIAKQLMLDVFEGFITDNPFPEKKFDYITGSQVIEHEPDPLRFLKSAKKKLKNGGQIILSFPNFDSVYRKIFGRRWLNWHIPYHINFFTGSSFEKLAKNAGLKIIKRRAITPNVWTLMQIRSLLISAKEGQKNPIWTSTTLRGDIWDSSFSLKNFILQSISTVFYILITPINRFIDSLGVGDSLFVILENEQ